MPDVSGLSVRRAMAHLAEWGLGMERRGVGRVVSQFPKAGQVVPNGRTVNVVLEDVERTWEHAARR